MGISVAYQRGDANPELSEYLPMIEGNLAAMRKWSVRNYPDPNYVCTEVKKQREKKMMIQGEDQVLIENQEEEDTRKVINLAGDEPQQPQETQNIKLSNINKDIELGNESLFDELMKLQGGNISHEEQLDMLLIGSDESRVLKSFTESKEELDAIKRQIKATIQSINSFTRTKEKYENEGYDETTGFRSFIKR